jgi:hypothetical protein
MTFRFNYLKITELVKRLRDKSDLIATSDTNSMSEQDMKKWHIDELKIALESMIERLDSNRRQLRSRADMVENLFTTWRNVVLGGVSFVAPAILGLSSVVRVLKEFMLQLLIADILIGLIMFIVFSFIKGKIHAHILSMDVCFLSAINKLNFLRDYSITETYYLDKIEDERINFFFNYGIFASTAVTADLIDEFENMANSVFFARIRHNLQQGLGIIMAGINVAIDFYEKSKSSWNNYRSDLQHLRYVHEYFFKYNIYKIEIETGRIEKQKDI